MSLPKFIVKYIDEIGVQKVETTISEVETKTSAELVPVVVKSSSRFGHVPIILFLIGVVIYFIFDLSMIAMNHTEWVSYLIIPYSVILLLGSYFLTRFDFIKRLFTQKMDMDEQVVKRALLEFYESNIRKTVDSTGILFFISIAERKAVVLADKAISDKLPKETWENIVSLIVSGMKRKDLSEGLIKALSSSAKILTPLFPIKTEDKNELPNTLIIKE